MGKSLRIVVIVALVALQVFVGIPEYMTDGPYMLRALSYSFFHASWWHLAINAIAIWTIYPPKRKVNFLQIVSSFLIAVAVYPLSFRPVIGFSNILYATLGLRTPSLSSAWWKQPTVIVFIVATLAMVFVPQLSATTHIAAFVCGMVCAALRRFYLKLTKDARRYY